jgi:hypothetical protein
MQSDEFNAGVLLLPTLSDRKCSNFRAHYQYRVLPGGCLPQIRYSANPISILSLLNDLKWAIHTTCEPPTYEGAGGWCRMITNWRRPTTGTKTTDHGGDQLIYTRVPAPKMRTFDVTPNPGSLEVLCGFRGCFGRHHRPRPQNEDLDSLCKSKSFLLCSFFKFSRLVSYFACT